MQVRVRVRKGIQWIAFGIVIKMEENEAWVEASMMDICWALCCGLGLDFW